jgi:hypothetical protein
MLGTQVNARIDAMVAGLAANGVTANASQVSAVKSYISSRRNYIAGQLNTAFGAVTFAPTGGNALTDDDGVLSLTGTAPVGVTALRINGAVLTPTWTSQSAWRLPVTLYATENALTLEGLDRRGSVVGSFPLTVTVTGPPPLPSVTFNEWMADNDGAGGLVDPADGRADDWFELYNGGATPVDLAGFRLTDDPASPAPFVIPSGTVLPAGGRLLIWADGEPEQNGVTPGQLHTPFRLNADGESLRLMTSGGTIIDEVTFGAQARGRSEGRFPDGGPVAGALSLPTPGDANALTRITGLDRAGPVVRITVQTSAGLSYQLEAGASLDAWSPVGPAATANGFSLSLDDPAPPGGVRFYRVRTSR